MMIKFDGRIVQFGFGAVGKSFYEKVSKEINFNENEYFVITRYAGEFDAYINLDGMAANFITHEITKDNFRSVFETYLSSGDMLIDFADTVGTKDICDWCYIDICVISKKNTIIAILLINTLLFYNMAIIPD